LRSPVKVAAAKTGHWSGSSEAMKRCDLLRAEDVADLLGAAPRPDRLGGVRAQPLARLARPVEGADEELADVVDGRGRELALQRLEELLDVHRPDVLERLRRERRREDLPPH
jgi:hypothetical protein